MCENDGEAAHLQKLMSCSPLGTEVDDGALNSAEDTLLLNMRSLHRGV